MQQLFAIPSRSVSLRSIYRADAGTGSAIDTLICIDHIFSVLFGDTADRTFAFA